MLLVSEPAPFQVGLVDCDHGFEWGCADRSRSWWLDDVVVERSVGAGWASEVPRSVVGREGRVALSRSLRGSVLRARGTCRPLSEVTSAVGWRLAIPPSGDAECEFREWSCVGVLPVGEVLCVLPFAFGAFRAVGLLQPAGDGPLRVLFREGEVRYGSPY